MNNTILADIKEINNLNPEQQKAVESTDGALLVLAGAGTGKTKVLTSRIAYILNNGLAYPSQILAVTFTNRASKEMRQRIDEMTDNMSSGMWLGTFHSVCLRIIRRHYAILGLPSDFSIIDSDDQIRLLKQLIAENNIDDKRFPPKAIAAYINRCKDKALTPDRAEGNEVERKIYGIYQRRMMSLGAVDFGDLILHCITLLSKNPDILADYHRRFQYLLVDEYQDTNVAQYLWLRLLAQGNKNICCVGDDDQSIYGWRGAEVANILRFEKDFKNAEIIRLKENYRSTPEILATAEALIANNSGRLGKSLSSQFEKGNKVKLASMWDDRTEARYIGGQIESIQLSSKHKLSETAILVRAGFQTRAFEECFLSMSIPYRIIGGLRFYERKEIRDAIAYIRAVVNPDNDLALERIINLPKRGIGGATVKKLRDFARENNISILAAIPAMCSPNTSILKGKIADRLLSLSTDFARWKEMLATISHTDLVDMILEESGYLPMWKAEKTPEAQGRVENLKELISAIGEFNDMAEFLEHVSLVMENESNPNRDMVNVMTMHGSKGLEFETVFLTGWEEGLFPSQKSMDENGTEGLEEERRLAYVGITRAKRNLTISFASNRFIHGQVVSSIPSRFVDELPDEHLEVVNTTGVGPSYQKSKKEFGNNIPTKPPKNDGTMQVGSRIFHQKFGYGKITAIIGDKLKINFDKSSSKTIIKDFVTHKP